MWLQTLGIVTLTVSLSSVCEGAEIRTPDDHKLTLSAMLNAQTNAEPEQIVSHNKPIEIYHLALDHLMGRNGLDKSPEKAASMFKALAEQNWSSAQHMLGNMYFSGKGVEKNDLLAYKWLSLASKNNIQLAEAIQEKRKLLHSKLRANLSDQSFNKVETWIAEWKPGSNEQQLN